MNEDPHLHRVYALSPAGAERLHPTPFPEPFYALYSQLAPGLYEAARTYPGGKVYGFERHMRRLRAGSQASGITLSLTEDQLRGGLQQAMDDHPSPLLKMRWDLCAEPYARLGTSARMLVTLTPLPEMPAWVFAEGVSVHTTTELVRHQPTTKGSAFAVERHRIPYGDRNYFEPLLLSPKGELLEGAQSNFGGFLEGRLYASTEGALPGITMGTLVELARANGLDLVQKPLTLTQLDSIDEAFLCSSVRGVIPVTSINRRSVGSGLPGGQVEHLARLYRTFATQTAARLWPREEL